MFQSLLSLEDDMIGDIMDAVRHWCEARSASIESALGRNALHIALNAVASSSISDLMSAIDNHFEGFAPVP